jgi:hypothetical protein
MALADIYGNRYSYEEWLPPLRDFDSSKYTPESQVRQSFLELEVKRHIPAQWALYDRGFLSKGPRVKPRRPWDIVRDPGQSIERRAKALFVLCDTEDPGMRAWVVEELDNANISPGWRAHLIDACESLDFTDTALRARLKTVLGHQIDRLLAERMEGPSLWTAVRRYGTLLDPVEAEVLCGLLNPERGLATRQVTLQALEYLIRLPGAPTEAATSRLRNAVGALLFDLLTLPAASRTAEQDALLLNALSAYTTLGDERAIEGARQFVAQADTLFRRLAIKRVEAIVESFRKHRQEGRTHAERALPRAEATLAALRT